MLARISKPKVEPYFLITFSTIHTHTHVNQSIPSINPFKRRFSLALIIDHVVQRTERPWHCVTTCLHRKHSIRALFTHTYRQIKHYPTLKITSVSHECKLRRAANGSNGIYISLKYRIWKQCPRHWQQWIDMVLRVCRPPQTLNVQPKTSKASKGHTSNLRTNPKSHRD